MSVYTVGEIAIWLAAAAVLGFVLGWLVRGARSTRTQATPAPAQQGAPLLALTSGPAGAPTRGGSHAGPQADRARPGAARSGDAHRSDEGGRRRAPDVVAPGAFPGSALPGVGGGAPSPVHQVKANIDSMTYHEPGTDRYRRVTADVWFVDAIAARAAGFRPAPEA